MPLTVRFEDHRDRVKALLARKLGALMSAAGEALAEEYREGLSTPAPPHSGVGEIPHAYLGWKPGGYGPTNPTGINNIPPEFDSVQSDYLSSYIDGGGGSEFGEPAGFVGFRPSHVGSRSQNYLLDHDRYGRPWVDELYFGSKPLIVAKAKAAFEDAR